MALRICNWLRIICDFINPIKVETMGNGIIYFAIDMVAVVVASALIYLILHLIAKANPDGTLAQPHGVRDVWIMLNGLLFGFLLVGIIWFLILD